MKNRMQIKNVLVLSEERENLKVGGWIRTSRSSKGLTFIALNDGSCFDSIQLVVEDSLNNYDEVSALGTGACIVATGDLVASPAKGQAWELKPSSIEIFGKTDEHYPLQKKRHSFEFLRSIAHLRPRANSFGAVFRMRSSLAMAVHSFFQERGFLYVHTPIITANDCEGAGEMFRVSTLPPENPPKKEGAVDWQQDFFGDKTGLTVSGQLQVEPYALSFSDVYTFGPTFRAENSHTSRHAAEFWMIEPEIAFADLATDCDLAEEFVRYMISWALEKLPDDMCFFNDRIEKGLIGRLERLVKSKFERISYTEAISLLQKSKGKFEFPVEWGLDLQSEHERYLTEQVFDGPVFVTDYPKDIKAFYMRMNDDEKTVAAMDLLVPKVGEIIGGSQREERLEPLQQRMADAGIEATHLEWYLDSRRWGSCPHAGFGLGFERLLMYVTGMENIRDVISYPRTPGNARF